ncbi:hypothetical protein ACTL33_004503, partial [Vibrio parahaemolyticus]
KKTFNRTNSNHFVYIPSDLGYFLSFKRIFPQEKRAFLPELRSSNLMQLEQMIFAQRAFSLRPAV